MRYESPKEALQDIVAIRASLHSPAYQTPRQTFQTVEDNIVRLRFRYDGVMGPQSYSTGLLLTKSGFLLTAAHSVEDITASWAESMMRHKLLPPTKRYAMTTRKGEEYPIDPTFFSVNAESDVAILKAVTGQRSEPTGVIVAKDHQQPGEIIKVAGFRQEVLQESYDRVLSTTAIPSKRIAETYPAEDYFASKAYVSHGMSGGPAINADGSIAGTILASYRNRLTPWRRSYSIFSKPHAIRTTIQQTSDELEKILRTMITHTPAVKHGNN